MTSHTPRAKAGATMLVVRLRHDLIRSDQPTTNAKARVSVASLNRDGRFLRDSAKPLSQHFNRRLQRVREITDAAISCEYASVGTWNMPVWITQWALNGAYSLKRYRRGQRLTQSCEEC